MSLRFVRPDKSHEEKAAAYIKEHAELGEIELHGASSLEVMDSYDLWLQHLARHQSWDTVPEGRVPASTFFVMDEDDEIVGCFDIRHALTEFLALYGGHIGYGVRPSRRRQGHGSEMLHLGLTYCKEELGLDRVMLGCNKANVASARVIQKNGGVLEREFELSEGRMVQVYWITL